MESNKLNELLDFLGPETKLIAVSKYRTKEEILDLYHKGQRVFAENRVQALLDRIEELPKDIEWHLIGHLQRNKVKQIIPHVHLTHSVDSIRLLKAIDKHGEQNNIKPAILLQVHIAQEDSKFGFTIEELLQLHETGDISAFNHVTVSGLMGMATFTEDKNQVKKEFRSLADVFNKLKSTYYKEKPEFKELSMGMSGDYQIAKECGSTMVRIGSLLFND